MLRLLDEAAELDPQIRWNALIGAEKVEFVHCEWESQPVVKSDSEQAVQSEMGDISQRLLEIVREQSRTRVPILCPGRIESGKDCADAAYHISPYAAAKGHHQRLDHILARCRWIDFA